MESVANVSTFPGNEIQLGHTVSHSYYEVDIRSGEPFEQALLSRPSFRVVSSVRRSPNWLLERYAMTSKLLYRATHLLPHDQMRVGFSFLFELFGTECETTPRLGEVQTVGSRYHGFVGT